MLLLQRREDVLDDAMKKELASFRDGQLERAVDSRKGVMIYAERTLGAEKHASLK